MFTNLPHSHNSAAFANNLQTNRDKTLYEAIKPEKQIWYKGLINNLLKIKSDKAG
jgi:hypothetical protein